MLDESTTPDLVELQRRLTAVTNRGDADAVVAFYASDAVYDMSPVWEGGKIARITNYTDIDEARAAAERLAQEWG
ncbi:MAG: hypothetical protein WB709_08385 [Solirubrobacteraceae bacterium]